MTEPVVRTVRTVHTRTVGSGTAVVTYDVPSESSTKPSSAPTASRRRGDQRGSSSSTPVGPVVTAQEVRVRPARLTAETTPCSEAVTVLGSMPTPQRTRSPTAHSR